MDEKIKTFNELYKKLLAVDKFDRMSSIEKDTFRILLDDSHDIMVYNNYKEVYLEYLTDNKQTTHYHPDYEEAYQDLERILADPEKELERIKNTAVNSRKAGIISGLISLGILAGILIAVFVVQQLS